LISPWDIVSGGRYRDSVSTRLGVEGRYDVACLMLREGWIQGSEMERKGVEALSDGEEEEEEKEEEEDAELAEMLALLEQGDEEEDEEEEYWVILEKKRAKAARKSHKVVLDKLMSEASESSWLPESNHEYPHIFRLGATSTVISLLCSDLWRGGGSPYGASMLCTMTELFLGAVAELTGRAWRPAPCSVWYPRDLISGWSLHTEDSIRHTEYGRLQVIF